MLQERRVQFGRHATKRVMAQAFAGKRRHRDSPQRIRQAVKLLRNGGKVVIGRRRGGDRVIVVLQITTGQVRNATAGQLCGDMGVARNQTMALRRMLCRIQPGAVLYQNLGPRGVVRRCTHRTGLWCSARA